MALPMLVALADWLFIAAIVMFALLLIVVVGTLWVVAMLVAWVVKQ